MPIQLFYRLIKTATFLGLIFIMPLVMATPLLSDKHIQRGLTCTQCHLESPPSRAVETQQCETCHGDYEKLAILTQHTLPYNPHDSHLGEPECGECHQGHQPSILACNECHTYNIPVP